MVDETVKNRREQAEGKANGAQELRREGEGEVSAKPHTLQTGDQPKPSARQRSDTPAQQIVQRFACEWSAFYPLHPGEVALVGAGPGDPGLLTVRALAIVAQAEVVLFDNLVSSEVLALLPERAERLFVGKERSRHHRTQEEIIADLIRFARAGRRVVRLKSGDPFIFGRGGEEVEALAAAGIPFQVVPGISAAVGAAAYSAIPLTHRHYAHACTFVSGHSHNGKEEEIDWRALAAPFHTVAFYMGRHHLPEICARLIAAGRDPATPAAIIQRATTPQQRIVEGTLATLPTLADREGIGAPSIVMIGEVVRCRATLTATAHEAETLLTS